ncbi:hypothetical protein NE237_007011 [Protea cynaroides]|uniref:Uncharacterized protein n=1 Tax=Protea cynaroides TaxID=273540 RepID=A0A9Q0KNF3_9MAGN|nr:hypothetical protein NE237_007011 [Protea cynaroides]
MLSDPKEHSTSFSRYWHGCSEGVCVCKETLRCLKGQRVLLDSLEWSYHRPRNWCNKTSEFSFRLVEEHQTVQISYSAFQMANILWRRKKMHEIKIREAFEVTESR